MRQGNNGRRPRGGRPNRRPGPQKTQTYDSNGPDVRIRGNAHQVYEKYLALARDATAGGDRVLAESYYQFAEHYYRIIHESTDPDSPGSHRPHFRDPRFDDRDSFGREWDGQGEEDGQGGEPPMQGGQAPVEGQRGEGQRGDYPRNDGPRNDGPRNDGQRNESRHDQRHEGPRNEGQRDQRGPRDNYRGERQDSQRQEGQRQEPRGDGQRNRDQRDGNRFQRDQEREGQRSEGPRENRVENRNEPRNEPRSEARVEPRRGDLDEDRSGLERTLGSSAPLPVAAIEEEVNGQPAREPQAAPQAAARARPRLRRRSQTEEAEPAAGGPGRRQFPPPADGEEPEATDS
jgi:hypothetical protein